jgi:hypothetical protein
MLADFSSMQAAVETVSDNKFEIAGWAAGLWAMLRILFVKYQDKLSPFLIGLLSKIPGFPAVALPIVEVGMAELLKIIVKYFESQGVPRVEALALATSFAKSSSPVLLKAATAQYETELAAATKLEV